MSLSVHVPEGLTFPLDFSGYDTLHSISERLTRAHGPQLQFANREYYYNSQAIPANAYLASLGIPSGATLECSMPMQVQVQVPTVAVAVAYPVVAAPPQLVRPLSIGIGPSYMSVNAPVAPSPRSAAPHPASPKNAGTSQAAQINTQQSSTSASSGAPATPRVPSSSSSSRSSSRPASRTNSLRHPIDPFEGLDHQTEGNPFDNIEKTLSRIESHPISDHLYGKPLSKEAEKSKAAMAKSSANMQKITEIREKMNRFATLPAQFNMAAAAAAYGGAHHPSSHATVHSQSAAVTPARSRSGSLTHQQAAAVNAAAKHRAMPSSPGFLQTFQFNSSMSGSQPPLQSQLSSGGSALSSITARLNEIQLAVQSIEEETKSLTDAHSKEKAALLNELELLQSRIHSAQADREVQTALIKGEMFELSAQLKEMEAKEQREIGQEKSKQQLIGTLIEKMMESKWAEDILRMFSDRMADRKAGIKEDQTTGSGTAGSSLPSADVGETKSNS